MEEERARQEASSKPSGPAPMAVEPAAATGAATASSSKPTVEDDMLAQAIAMSMGKVCSNMCRKGGVGGI